MEDRLTVACITQSQGTAVGGAATSLAPNRAPQTPNPDFRSLRNHFNAKEKLKQLFFLNVFTCLEETIHQETTGFFPHGNIYLLRILYTGTKSSKALHKNSWQTY